MFSSGGIKMPHGRESVGPLELWLPCGKCEIDVRCAQTSGTTHSFVVEEAATYTPQEIVVQIGT